MEFSVLACLAVTVADWVLEVYPVAVVVICWLVVSVVNSTYIPPLMLASPRLPW